MGKVVVICQIGIVVVRIQIGGQKHDEQIVDSVNVIDRKGQKILDESINIASDGIILILEIMVTKVRKEQKVILKRMSGLIELI